MSSGTAKKPLLKLLMLHGYRQSEKAFRERTGGLRKSLKNYAEFVFCSAPHEIPSGQDSEEANNTAVDGAVDEQRGWWFSRSDRSYNALETTDCDLGFQQSLEHINQVFRTQGPFDGVFAFSQGACFAAMLCKLASDQEFDSNVRQKYDSIRFKFAVLVAGFKSGQSQHEMFFDKLVDKRCKMPTMHVIGEVDKVISCEMSTSLLEYFENPTVFRHTGGHFVPVNAEAKNAFIEFFNRVTADKV